MKLFELYRVRPLREDKNLTAAIQLCESVVSLLEGLNDAGSFGVFLKGGSLGEWDKTAKKTFPTKEEARAFAKRRNSQLSPGEKKHYRMRYVVKPMSGVTEADYEGGIDFEPDAEFAGVKGVSRDSGAGNLAAKQAEQKQQEVKLNQTWQRLIKTLKTMNPNQAQTMKANMNKVAQMAKQKGFTLSPSPEQVLGL